MEEGQTSKRRRFMETASDSKVRICFKSQDGCKTYFRVANSTKIQVLLKSYCDEKKIEYRTAIFLHDGARVPRRGTLDEVGVVDQAEIDVMIPQRGGAPQNI